MVKKLLSLIFAISFMTAQTVQAIYNPHETTNNYFGIHILEQADLEDAYKLVNSSGGEWGYITLVIRDDQRIFTQWYDFFNSLRDKKLIPLVRIATHAQGDYWVKPELEDAAVWAKFLDELPWPTNNRYVILFNEPNHAKEWGGEIQPVEYAQIASHYHQALKEKSPDFFVLNAGFDVSASNTASTMDALVYWQQMEEEIPGIFNLFDGWVSHSYPNPGFSQSPYKTGRQSIVSYRYEQDYLENHFASPKKYVFVTETGWVTGSGLSEADVASYYRIAFSEIWTDSQIVAVTPFLLNYPADVFASFSWKSPDGGYRQQYQEVLGLAKEAGLPQEAPLTPFGRLMRKISKETGAIISFIPTLSI